MKKLPKIELHSLVPFSLAVSVAGLCLMLTEISDLMQIGAILFALGLLPISLVLFKTSDRHTDA